MGELPFIDEHSRIVDAPAARVWEALPGLAAGSMLGRASKQLAGLLGAEQTTGSGRRGAVGSTIAGFRVVRAEPPNELALEGRHRFARYALLFHVDELGQERSRLRAETRADFPGVRGRVYRGLVIGSRGHVLAVHQLLRSVARRAEDERMGA